MSFYNGILNHDDIHGSGQIGPRGLPGVGFDLDSNNDYDMQNKKLVNVKPGVNGSDAVTKSQLDTKTSLLDGARTHGYIVNNRAVIYSQSGAVHAKSFYLQDQNEDEVRILTDNQDFDNVHLFVPNLKNFDGFGGRKRSEIMVTSVDQIISGNKFFQNILKASNPTEDSDVANKNYIDFEITKQTVLIDNEFVKKSGSLMTGDLILPHHNYPVQGNTNKAISYETQREIFISRKETFPVETSLDMNNNFLVNVKDPTNNDHGVNKKYVDDLTNTKLDKLILKDVNLNNKQLKNLGFDIKDQADVVNLGFTDKKYLQKVSNSDLNMDEHRVTNSLDPVNSRDLANKNYVDGEISKITTVDTNQFVLKSGSTMTGDLNMNNHSITNVKQPISNTDVATKGYLDNTLAESHLTSSHTKNEFKYLDDPNDTSSEYNITVDAFTDFNESPHKNKKAFQVSLQKDAGTNNYRSRMGFNLYPLPLGTYTIIFEYYFPENTNIQLSCQSTTAYVHKQVQKDFTDYSKLLVQINNNSKTTPDYLFFTIHGAAVVSNPEGYIIVYGVKDWSDSVDSSVYDDAFYVQMFKYKNGDMQMQTDIDLNNNKIKNVPQPTNPTDC